ncbi:hypothetical protein TcasGA2_TC031891 [Tribolium castaneum]|uniref:Uncharacterized protein n=1 Tax=Tribolium castaneum TaxID=7070 RepID=A0A139W8M9_TRICA|nr:hypothetical protein TcasGA2_TC031891 [Tribolium castaneum]
MESTRWSEPLGVPLATVFLESPGWVRVINFAFKFPAQFSEIQHSISWLPSTRSNSF